MKEICIFSTKCQKYFPENCVTVKSASYYVAILLTVLVFKFKFLTYNGIMFNSIPVKLH